MKRKTKFILALLAVLFVALCVALYFVHPMAPLMLLLSMAIQVPIILAITRASMNGTYRDRSFERRQEYLKEGDAAAWLAQEEREAASVGHRFWSPASRTLCALNRAECLCALGRKTEAAGLLAGIEENKLPGYDRPRYAQVVEALRASDSDRAVDAADEAGE